ncbi:STAS domain-containing protein [Streptomyces sp. NPDC058700]|uniref:STAS domain-containing protein n=1 Tax=unclassified Streptomyces TaxID=2593676 RepID=UPI0036695A84
MDSTSGNLSPRDDEGTTARTDQYTVGGACVVVARGDLDLSTLQPLTDALTTAGSTYPVVILDASEITFGDSTFLNLVLHTHSTTALRVVAPDEQLRRLFEITGADTVLDIRPTVEAALSPPPSP